MSRAQHTHVVAACSATQLQHELSMQIIQQLITAAAATTAAAADAVSSDPT
jgi:hypothetical protein